MNQIINVSTGDTIGYAESVRYIKRSSSGAFVQTDEEHAQGIAYMSKPYNLYGREGLGLEDTARLIPIDSGEILHFTENAADNAMRNVETTIGGSYAADRRYEPGEYLIVGGTMYKVLLPIMPGAFLTPGTNIEETTIQAEIAKMNKEEP